MSPMKKKKGLLPKVSSSQKDVVLRELLNDPHTVEAELKKIEKENPEVKWLIDNYCNLAVEPHDVKVIGALVYKLLEGQIEADELDQLFFGKKEK